MTLSAVFRGHAARAAWWRWLGAGTTAAAWRGRGGAGPW